MIGDSCWTKDKRPRVVILWSFLRTCGSADRFEAAASSRKAFSGNVSSLQVHFAYEDATCLRKSHHGGKEFPMMQLEGKVALVTGANGGLGTTMTETFLEAGATVVGVARSIQQAVFANPRFMAMPADLTRGESARELVEQVIARLGKIDVLVHVLGGYAGGESIESTDDATWDKMMNLNVRSLFNILREVLPPMRRAMQGRIVAIGARSAVEPAAGLSAYCASKAALVSLVRTAALVSLVFYFGPLWQSNLAHPL
ncbi:MAG: SDR family NAD(P)-dependent oxidoreductase [Acidimicrobiia bacterium]|nr:SDR family NAD(P)-dependent oxidoreductase [Acidimicrobiia bacterium]